MPELPEVETSGRALKEYLAGRTIEGVQIFTERLREPLDSLKNPILTGRKVLDVRRRGRYLIVDLEENLALLMHFGMSGVLKTVPLDQERAKHEHIIFDLGNNDSLVLSQIPAQWSICEAEESYGVVFVQRECSGKTAPQGSQDICFMRQPAYSGCASRSL